MLRRGINFCSKRNKTGTANLKLFSRTYYTQVEKGVTFGDIEEKTNRNLTKILRSVAEIMDYREK